MKTRKTLYRCAVVVYLWFGVLCYVLAARPAPMVRIVSHPVHFRFEAPTAPGR